MGPRPGYLNRLADCFRVDARAALIRRAVESARICFGLIFAHRWLAIAGYSVIADDPSTVDAISAVGVVFGLLIASGFLTQPVIVAAIGYFLIDPPLASTLGDQAACLMCWALLFAGAGRRWSVDSLLRRRRRFKSAYRYLFPFALPLTRRTFAWIRLFQIFLYWGLGVSAMSYHFNDPTWIRLETLQLFYTMPYMSNFYGLFEGFHQQAPVMFDLFSRISLLLQTIWELLLFPLMLFRIGRFFTVIQAMLFFVFSALCFNLGYLPFFELVWWWLIFGSPYILSGKINSLWHADQGAPQISLSLRRLPLLPVACLAVGIASSTSFIAGISLSGLALNETSTALADKILSPVPLYRTFGQHPINVFNIQDLMLGSESLILVELDSGGSAQRVVPYFDGSGGRLEWHRNDLLYFDNSLKWQRATVADRFDAAGNPTAFTIKYLERLVRLDAALRREQSPIRYRAMFLRRSIDTTGAYPIWTGQRCHLAFDFTYQPKSYGSAGSGAYSTPPGHWRDESRLTWTFAAVRSGERPQFSCERVLSNTTAEFGLN